MEAKLVVVGGKANKSEVKLKLPAMIGRSRDADITVSHASVSRHHCLVYELDGALVVRDNGSLNGTVIDGQRIQEELLKPGQSLTIGPLTFRADYEYDGEFPVIGAAPVVVAEANGKAVANGPRSAPKPSEPMPEESSFAEPEAAEPEAAEPEAAEAADDEPEAAEPAIAEAADDEPADDEPADAVDEAVDAALPDLSAGEEASADESAPDGFDFLDEEPAASPTSSAPSFGFLKESNAADDDIEDSTAVFRIADEPAPAAAKPAEKSPSRSKPAEKSAAAAATGDDDAALDDFLNSLGLEE